jgi:hypothetical protein
MGGHKCLATQIKLSEAESKAASVLKIRMINKDSPEAIIISL